MHKDNITRPMKAMFTDTSPVDQPKDSYRYALNTVDQSTEGDIYKLSNEKGQLAVTQLPEGHIFLGAINMTGSRLVIFSTNPETQVSEIGLLENDNYQSVVNDTYSTNKLDFRVTHQISGVYRLRSGCEDTIYFVDGKSLRYFNFAKQEDFKIDGLWDADLFKLQKTLKSITDFGEVTIEDGGNILPGAYSASIQFLDYDLNPTEWFISTDTIIIYSDRDNKEFGEIRGDQYFEVPDQDPPYIDKAIRFRLKNIDKSFPYYRIAVLERSNIAGTVRQVVTSEPIPTEVDNYLFTGSETSVITEQELQVFDFIIESAEHITTVDNQLIVSGLKGKQVSYCKLQQYASKIQVDAAPRDIKLNDISQLGNPKRGTVHLEYMPYQPGELYALGIVYVFKDGTRSPVFHIPGKNPSTTGRAFIPGMIPMSTNNEVEAYYTDNDNNCEGPSLWGVDSQGEPLTEKTKVRHHRFPTRQEAGIGFVRTQSTEEQGARVRTLQLSFKTRFKESTLQVPYPVDFTLKYYIGGVQKTATLTIDDFVLPRHLYMTLDMGIITNQTLDGEQADGRVMNFQLTARGEKDDGGIDVIEDDLRDVTLRLLDGASDTFINRNYEATVMGLALSGIEQPDIEEEIVGYYIVRAERDEYNKTVLDTGVILPLVEDTHYTAFGLIRPSTAVGDAHGVGDLESRQRQWLYKQKKVTNFQHAKIPKDTFAIIHPQFLFNRKEYLTAKLNVEGYYRAADNSVYMDHQITQDVMAGTSYDSSRNKKREADSDGFSLHTLTRYTPQQFVPTSTPNRLPTDEIFYLDTLYGKTLPKRTGDGTREIYNLSADNRIGIVTATEERDVFQNNQYPYVSMTRELPGAYQNFRVLPYYLDSKEMHTFDQEYIEVFGGDCYISPMTFSSSMYYNTKLRKRKNKKSFLKFLVAGLLIVAAVAVNFIPIVGQVASGVIGAAAIAGLTGSAVSLALNMAANGFRQAQANKVYNELYDKGLKDCIDDQVTKEIFENHNPDDDELQWVMDSAANLWFESQINMNWRFGVDSVSTDYLNSPIRYNEALVSEYLINKLTSFDKDNSEGKLYNGFANPEVYGINRSYMMRNTSKVYTMLGLEYDCCSGCLEEFPHRTAYSLQSFQEELTDNYRKFLPNNYRDLDGETGRITNLFTLGNNLYIHTEEGLWLVPRNYQERVTDQIVSFIGTGSFFSVPPQKIVDSAFGIAGGLQHKWGAVKTPAGYCYVSVNEGRVYLFDGKQAKPISDAGMSKEFEKLLTYKEDNPSAEDLGGYLMSYDPVYERVLLTQTGGFTISYSLAAQGWRSYHSYLPYAYMTTTKEHYQMYYGSPLIHKTAEGPYQTFQGVKYAHVIQFISVSTPIQQRKWNSIRLDTEVFEGELFIDDVTFTRAGLFNTTQSTGTLELVVDNPSVYMMGQEVVNNNNSSIRVTRENSSWYFNDFRDISVNTREPILVNAPYPILNPFRTDVNKPWYEQIPMQDKWLGIILEFYTTEGDYKIITNFVVDNEQAKL